MRCRTIVCLAILILPLASCGDEQSGRRDLRWWTRERETPVTEQAGAADRSGAEPAYTAADAMSYGSDDQPQELAQPTAPPSQPAGPATQWPTQDLPAVSHVRPTYATPTPAEQTPPVPTSATLAERTPAVATAAAPPRRADATVPAPTDESEIERVMAESIAGRTPSAPSHSVAEPDPPSDVRDVAAARPARVAAAVTSQPPVEIEHPSQLPQSPPPEATRPTDLADLPARDDPPVDGGVRSLAALAEPDQAATEPSDAVPAPAAVSPAATRRVQQGTTELVAASMVQVDDKFITIDNVLTGLYQKLIAMPAGDEDTFRQAVVPMIEQQLRQQVYESLVLAEAEASLTDAHKEVIEQEVADARREMIAHAGGSEQALEQYYRDRHTTLADALDDHRRRLTGRLYLQSQIEPSIVITREMLLDYYHKHPEEFVVAKSVQMQLIAMSFENFLPDTGAMEPTPLEWQRARQQARTEIDAAAEAIMAGEDFGEVAKRHSRGFRAGRGGVWPAMPEGSFREAEVERNAFALNEGDICGVIETENGYYIVKALKVEPGKSVSFAEAQEQIEEALRIEQYDRLASDYFMELFGAATIAQSDEFMEMATDAAVDRYWRAN